MSNRIVIFLGKHDKPLLLSHIGRDEEGNLLSGHVVNGHWEYEIKPGDVINKEVVVPNDTTGDYDEIIKWARTQ